MKSLFLYLTGCLAGSVLLTPVSAQTDQGAEAADLPAAAKSFVGLLSKGEFEKAIKDFDEAMRKAMPAKELEKTWKGLLAKYGAFKEHKGTRTATSGKYRIIYVTCVFEKATLDTRVVFDSDGHISGLFFALHEEYQAPAYVHKDRFRETEVKIGSGDWELPATLALPEGKGPYPAVVLVHGSGAHDRDETIGPNKPFRDLAGGLASQGIAVLRYVKRTKAHQAKMAALKDTLTVKEEVIDDALAAVALLRKTPKIDGKKIFVLGHSLGGTLVPTMASQDAAIAGIISLAGSTRPLEEILVEQLDYVLPLNPTLPTEQKKQLEKARQQAAALKDLKLTRQTPSSQLPFGLSALYLLSLRDNSPLALAGRLKQPALILQGERDYQVTHCGVDQEILMRCR
jgi:dienelactone hydrolase